MWRAVGGDEACGGGGSSVPGRAHHATSSEIGALLVLLAIAKKALKCPYTIWYQVVSLQEVQVLSTSAS